MNQIKIKDFSLKHTMESGQFFLYEKKDDDFYYIIQNDNIFKIKQENNTLFYKGTKNINKEFITHFFSLDEDLQEQTKTFEDKILTTALEKYWGLRHIKQDLWQCMIGFVCSSRSSIPKIQNNLKLISQTFGTKIEFDGKTFHTFPTYNQINNLEKLNQCKTGYRTRFIYSICHKLQKNDNLIQIKQENYENSKKLLLEFLGIGEKVADCICLFALNHKESFPIDTWIHQIIKQLYLNKEETTIKEINKFIQTQFKKNKGLAQQYLFHYARHNLK